MTSIPARSPQTEALTAWLATQVQAPIGHGAAPDEPHGWTDAPGDTPFIGYLVIHSIPGGQIDGDLAHPSVDGDLVWQINTHGATQQQAERLADAVQQALLGQRPPLVIAGRALLWVRSDIPHGAARIDVDQPSIWWSTGRYRIGTTPAP